MFKTLQVFLAGAIMLSVATLAQGGLLARQGNFLQDDDIVLFDFTNLVAGLVTIETFGYAGGTDNNGDAIPAGGFDPVIALFSAAGGLPLLALDDDGATRTDPVTGAAFDSLLSIVLPAGQYFVALTQYDNFAMGPNFSDGFLETGNGSFTAPFCGIGASAPFCDVTGAQRNGHYSINISGPSVVPEPGSLALIGLLVPGLLLARKSRRTA